MLSTQYQQDFERVINDLTPVLLSICDFNEQVAQAYIKLYLIEAPFSLTGFNKIAQLDKLSQWSFYRQHMMGLIYKYDLSRFRIPPQFSR